MRDIEEVNIHCTTGIFFFFCQRAPTGGGNWWLLRVWWCEPCGWWTPQGQSWPCHPRAISRLPSPLTQHITGLHGVNETRKVLQERGASFLPLTATDTWDWQKRAFHPVTSPPSCSVHTFFRPIHRLVPARCCRDDLPYSNLCGLYCFMSGGLEKPENLCHALAPWVKATYVWAFQKHVSWLSWAILHLLGSQRISGENIDYGD